MTIDKPASKNGGYSSLDSKPLVLIKATIDDLDRKEGRRPRMLVTGMDQKGHDRTTKWLASSFSEMGFDVDISLIKQTPHEVAKAAVENDVGFICVSSPGSVNPSLLSRLSNSLKAKSREDTLIIVGGNIPSEDHQALYQSGASKVFDVNQPAVNFANWLGQVESGTEISQDGGYYVKGVMGQDRSIIAKAITLIESALPSHQITAKTVIDTLLPFTGKALRIGISGVPGVGKSSFIESFGMMLTEKGYRVAVLAVDPSSSRSGGSIMGDKTRMERLSVEPNVFIRPSPSGGTLGGVTRKTRETMVICEAAGFDVIIVETVGVGQSEIAVSSMVDFFLVMLLAGAGDEIQGIKRGIIEFADAIAINKADGDNIKKAMEAKRDYQSALSILCPPSRAWSPPVLTCSAHTMDGIDAIWEIIVNHREKLKAAGELDKRRRRQALAWMWELIEDGLIDRFQKNTSVKKLLPKIIEAVQNGKTPASVAVHQLLSLDR